MIQEYWECVEDKGSIWSRKWNKNTPLAVEAAILLALVNVIESNTRGHEEGKIKMHMDCKKSWEMVTSERLKSSKLAGHRGSIISKILEVERKSNIEFEHVHVRTTEGSESGENNEGLKMVLKCDKLAKEERLKCVVENRIHDKEVEENMSL